MEEQHLQMQDRSHGQWLLSKCVVKANPSGNPQIGSQMSEKTPGTKKGIIHGRKPDPLAQQGSIGDTGFSKAYNSLQPSPVIHKVSKNLESLSTHKNASSCSGNKSIDPESVKDKPLTESMVKDVYADVFQGLGKFPGEPYKFRLKPDAVTAKHKPRTVPLSRQAALHAEIQSLINQDVFQPSTEHTEWVNSFVIVEKKVIVDSSGPHSPNHSQTKKIRLWLLQQICWWINSQIQWGKVLHYCGYEQGILASWIRSRIKKVHHYGIEYRKIPVET